jgi:hypothetical protein
MNKWEKKEYVYLDTIVQVIQFSGVGFLHKFEGHMPAHFLAVPKLCVWSKYL